MKISLVKRAARCVAVPLAAGSLLLAGDASAGAAFAGFKANEIQAKHFDFENQAGGLKCVPKGKLAELVGEPNKCYLELDKCQASVSALEGKLDAELLDMLADLVRVGEGEKVEFLAECPGDGPQFTHLLAIKGLGYAKATQHLPLLLELVSEKRIEKAGAGVRSAVAEALWWMGDKEQAVPALARLIAFDTRNDDHKPTALQALGRWKSDASVEWCKGALSAKHNDDILKSCITYLGTVGAKDSASTLVRHLEKYPDEVVRALGLMGDAAQVKTLEKYLDDKDGQPWKRMPALVALVNLGQAKHWAEMELYLQGQKPLSKKEQEKLAEKQNKEKAKKGKKKPAKAEKPKKPDFKLIQQAAMEAVLVKDAKLAAKVDKALAAAAKLGDDKDWQAKVYATAALGQRGDAKAAAALAEMLESPAEKVRLTVLDTIGGRDEVVGSNWMNRGIGVVASKELLPAVVKFYSAEGKQEYKTKALRAMVSIRAMAEVK